MSNTEGLYEKKWRDECEAGKVVREQRDKLHATLSDIVAAWDAMPENVRTSLNAKTEARRFTSAVLRASEMLYPRTVQVPQQVYEFRCTRSVLYDLGTPGFDKPSARQGHYIFAVSEVAAREIMYARFPDDQFKQRVKDTRPLFTVDKKGPAPEHIKADTK